MKNFTLPQFLSTFSNRVYLLAAFACGFIFSLAYPSRHLPQIPGAQVVALVCFYFMVFTLLRKPRENLTLLVLLHVSFIQASNHLFIFVQSTLRVFSGIPAYYSWPIFFTICFTQLSALWPTLFFALNRFSLLNGPKGKAFDSRLSKSPSVFLIFLALTFTAFEASDFQIYPVRIGYTFIDLAPRLPLAPLFGAEIYSFVIFLFSLSTAFYFATKRKPVVAWLSLALIGVANFSLSPLSKAPSESADSKTVSVRFMQNTIGNYFELPDRNEAKFRINKTLGTFFHWSRQSPAPDLIVFPENTIPSEGTFADFQAKLPKWFSEQTDSIHSPILASLVSPIPTQTEVQAPDFEVKGFLVDRGRVTQHGTKMKLLPFAEEFFFPRILNQLRPKQPDGKGPTPWISIVRGKSATVFDTGKVSFIAPICYEVLFPNVLRQWLLSSKAGVDLIINPSNDWWYGDSTQHILHFWALRWRALETGLPVIRVARTGVSGVVHPDGSVTEQMGFMEEGFRDAKLRLLTTAKRSLYVLWGEYPWWILWTLFLVTLYSGQFLSLIKPRDSSY